MTRAYISLNGEWTFHGPNGSVEQVNIPHTWNGKDGQDGGNDYWRGTCTYEKNFRQPEFDSEKQRVYLEFQGVNSTADVEINGNLAVHHDGGYSTFRADITEMLQEENRLTVRVDNSTNDRVYPQKADFTFYGGIYRDVALIVVSQNHFDLDYFGGKGIKITPKLEKGCGKIHVETFVTGTGTVEISLLDAKGNQVASGEGQDIILDIPNAHLWNGLEDPYLYRAVARLVKSGEVVDQVEDHFGVRVFEVDPKKGFFLNGRSYPLRGVCRHQDRPGIGNAISQAIHEEDMALIREIGANTIRLAHYQHDQHFYDLCDKYGLIVWAEIPYISEHMPSGRENTISQMTELIVQNYNHPSIVCWGVSNEITISTKNKRDMLDNHRALNDLCHRLDPTRFTTLACYAMCGPFNRSAHITDVVSWNLYLGWYVPGLWLNDMWVKFFHTVYPNRCLGFSEYGCEAMPNLHASHPRRGDHTEEYQCVYHEYMLRFFDRNPWMWGTHVWNMFDFAADARDQGGEPGMNHKGLVTFDRKTRKDSFYAYKAWWSKEPFVHLCGKRYVDRPESETMVKVYSNQPSVSLYVNGKLFSEQRGDKVFTFRIPLGEGETRLEVHSGELTDSAVLRRVDEPNPAYTLVKHKKSQNWV